MPSEEVELMRGRSIDMGRYEGRFMGDNNCADIFTTPVDSALLFLIPIALIHEIIRSMLFVY